MGNNESTGYKIVSQEDGLNINSNKITDVKNCNDDDNDSESKTDISDKPISAALKENLDNLITEIEKAKPEDIKKILSEYTKKTVVTFYKTAKCISFFRKKDQKAIILASLVPQTKINLIQIYFNAQIPIEMYKLMENLDFNSLDKNKETFLFRIQSDMIGYLNKVLNITDKIDINFQQNSRTFLMYIVNNHITKFTKDYYELIEILVRQNFDFNVKYITGHTVLSIALAYNKHLVFHLADFMKIESYDITIEVYWLYLLLNNHYDHIHNYIYYIGLRKDYMSLLYRLFKSYSYPSCDHDFTMFLIKWNQQTSKILKKACIEYVDSDGNTVVHLMAARRCKKLLAYINDIFPDIKFKPNNKGLTIQDLYVQNKVKNRLMHMSEKNENTNTSVQQYQQ
jgi:ribosomal protein L30E